jgi:signal transduction histidine kinase
MPRHHPTSQEIGLRSKISGGAMRVLLVEDNPIDAQTLRERLEEGGGELQFEHVTSLTELEAVFARAGSKRDAGVDVVLLDLSLDDSSGVETLRRARGIVGEVPIAILTADDDETRALEMLREGAEDYLVKGHYSIDTLMRAIRYARERHELQRRLAHADRLAAVGQLAAGVAHEVANPASLVLANTELLADLLTALQAPRGTASGAGLNPDFAISECVRMVEQNREALGRIRSVVRDLQGYARLHRAEVTEVRLHELVERTCNLVNASLRHRATLVRDLQPVPPIAADPSKLEQVITNLLLNASQAVESSERAEGRIRVSTRVEDAGIRVTVEDDGCGMSPELCDRIFEPFFTTKQPERGTGLGLAIAAEITRQHHGEITCTSELGHGTRFDVLLPMDTGLRLATTRPSAPPRERRRARLLLVDDEVAVADVHAELLGEHHNVVVAHGGREACALLDEDHAFDAIICDLMMPEVDGVDVYEHARRLDPGLSQRIILCSGGLVTERSRDFAASIDNPLLYKPVSAGDLLKAIDRMLGAGGTAESAEPGSPA